MSAAIKIYTDGACKGNPGKGGWAYIFVVDDAIVKQHSAHVSNTTNNRMEMSAVLEALKSIELDKAFEVPYEIFVDSKYVFSGMTSWISSWKKKEWKNSQGKVVLNIDLWKELDYFNTKYAHALRWNWVKAHNGDKYNEIVDSLASAAAAASSG